MNAAFIKYQFKKEIPLTDFCNGDEHKIVLREPTTGEFKTIAKIAKALSSGSNNGEVDTEEVADALECFCDILPPLIIDHDFFAVEKATEKLPAKEVAQFLGSKVDCATYVFSTYMGSLPLLQKSSK